MATAASGARPPARQASVSSSCSSSASALVYSPVQSTATAPLGRRGRESGGTGLWSYKIDNSRTSSRTKLPQRTQGSPCCAFERKPFVLQIAQVPADVPLPSTTRKYACTGNSRAGLGKPLPSLGCSSIWEMITKVISASPLERPPFYKHPPTPPNVRARCRSHRGFLYTYNYHNTPRVLIAACAQKQKTAQEQRAYFQFNSPCSAIGSW